MTNIYKNPRPQTHVRSQTGITFTSPQLTATLIAAAIRKTQVPTMQHLIASFAISD